MIVLASDVFEEEGTNFDKNNSNCNRFTAHELNSFYSAVACAHPPCPSSSLDVIIVAHIQDIGDITLLFRKITTAEVSKTAQMLSRKSKGQSPNELSWKHLESLLLPLLPFLLKYLTVPSAQIFIQISPLNKCNNPQSVSDIRPISSLCHLAKVFDKIIVTQISQHLETNSLLSPFQFCACYRATTKT